MSDQPLRFRHVVIDPDPPGRLHDITLFADLSGDGRPDVIIGGKRGPPNLFWYENPASRADAASAGEGSAWVRHDMADAPELEAGGALLDITGDGRLDVVAGQQISGNELYWFECPADPTAPWTKRVIEDRFRKYHDQVVGDVDGDGEPEIVAVSQRGHVLFYYDIPPDPRVEPWPRDCFHLIADGTSEYLEGLAIVDLDGDGRIELLAGPNVYRPAGPGEPWRLVQQFAEDFVKTRVDVADLSGAGRLDVVLAEGESDPGRLAVCSPPDWAPRVLRDDLFHPHSLEIADFDGDGRPDIFTGEMGLGGKTDSRLLVYLNRGGGEFEEVVISRGIPSHEAKVADLDGDGRPDIVGKPYEPERHIDAWFNETT